MGNVHIMFRNRGDDFSSCLFLTSNLSAQSDIDKNPRSVFTKLIQYLFDWVGKYITDNKIKDATGKNFILPNFQYGRDQFKSIPTE